MTTFQNQASNEIVVQDDGATAENEQEEEYGEDFDEEDVMDDGDPYENFGPGDVYTNKSDGANGWIPTALCFPPLPPPYTSRRPPAPARLRCRACTGLAFLPRSAWPQRARLPPANPARAPPAPRSFLYQCTSLLIHMRRCPRSPLSLPAVPARRFRRSLPPASTTLTKDLAKLVTIGLYLIRPSSTLYLTPWTIFWLSTPPFTENERRLALVFPASAFHAFVVQNVSRMRYSDLHWTLGRWRNFKGFPCWLRKEKRGLIQRLFFPPPSELRTIMLIPRASCASSDARLQKHWTGLQLSCCSPVQSSASCCMHPLSNACSHYPPWSYAAHALHPAPRTPPTPC
ncbi:hypothetical protein C8R44DRAFT_885700 [Mycena epipterygia]|nr:hypothetical protein C8R44DRAFT_885700 [Mycena epipterygia]